MSFDWSPLWLGLQAAALSTAIALGLGPWLAYLLRRQAAGWLAWLPLSVAHPLLFAYCLVASPFQWTIAALVAATFSLPYLMRAAAAAYDALKPEYFHAASGLGASEWLVFSRIAGPLALGPILAAGALVFASVAADCAVVLMLGRGVRTGGALPAGPLAVTVAISLAIHFLGMRLMRGSFRP